MTRSPLEPDDPVLWWGQRPLTRAEYDARSRAGQAGLRLVARLHVALTTLLTGAVIVLGVPLASSGPWWHWLGYAIAVTASTLLTSAVVVPAVALLRYARDQRCPSGPDDPDRTPDSS